MLTPERLREIKERCERATPGPWWTADGYIYDSETAIGSMYAEADNDFVVHAREDVPALVAEVERLWDFRFLMRQIAGSWRQYAETAVNYATNEQEAAAAKVRAQMLVECAEAIELALRDMEGGQGDQ